MKLLKDYFLVLIGSLFMGLGIALTKCAELGLSTISSVPNVISIKFSFLTLGTWSAIWNMVMILAQILILGKKFKPVEFMQVPVSIVFGWFTDFGVWAFSYIPTSLYVIKLAMTVAGIIVLAFGIAVMIIANRVMNPAEALVKVVADKLNKDFSNIKIAFDAFCVALAIVLSLTFFNFKIVGIGVGTILAMSTGVFIKFFAKNLLKLFDASFCFSLRDDF